MFKLWLLAALFYTLIPTCDAQTTAPSTPTTAPAAGTPTAVLPAPTFLILLDPPNKVILSGETKEYNTTDGPVFLEQQSTGELNVYKGESATEEFLIWTNGFSGDFGEYYTRLGPSGELATTEGNLDNKGKKKWIAGEIGEEDNAYYLVLNADESVSIIHNTPTGTDDDEIIWTSKLSSVPTITVTDPEPSPAPIPQPIILLDPPNKEILSGEIKEYNTTDGLVFLEQKDSGELKVYKGDSATDEFLVWTNGFSDGDFGEYYTRMGPTGELATIEGNPADKGKKKWIAGEIGEEDNAYYFVLNPDYESVSVIHNMPTGTDDDEIIWTSTLSSAPSPAAVPEPVPTAPTTDLEPTADPTTDLGPTVTPVPIPTILLDPPNKEILSGVITEYDTPDGPVFLEQKDTGELNVYKGDDTTEEYLIWTNGFSGGEFGEYYTKMGPNGELATIEGNPDDKGKKVWIAGEIGVEDNAYYFVLNPDESVSVIHNMPTGTDDDEIIWTSQLSSVPSAEPQPTMEPTEAVPTMTPEFEPTVTPEFEPTEEPLPSSTSVVLLDPPNKVILSGEMKEYETTDGMDFVFLEQKSTGELNVYRGESTESKTLVWSSGFTGDYGEYYTRMAPNGNLVTQEGNLDNKGKKTWSTDTAGEEDNRYYFVLNTADTVSIVHALGDADAEEVIWTSRMTDSPTVTPPTTPTTPVPPTPAPTTGSPTSSACFNARGLLSFAVSMVAASLGVTWMI